MTTGKISPFVMYEPDENARRTHPGSPRYWRSFRISDFGSQFSGEEVFGKQENEFLSCVINIVKNNLITLSNLSIYNFKNSINPILLSSQEYFVIRNKTKIRLKIPYKIIRIQIGSYLLVPK